MMKQRIRVFIINSECHPQLIKLMCGVLCVSRALMVNTLHVVLSTALFTYLKLFPKSWYIH